MRWAEGTGGDAAAGPQPSICLLLVHRKRASVEQGGLESGYQVSSELAAFVRKYDTSVSSAARSALSLRGSTTRTRRNFGKRWRKWRANGGSFVNLDNSFGKKIWPEYTAPFCKGLGWWWAIITFLITMRPAMNCSRPRHLLYRGKPGEFEEYWGYVEKLPYLIGDFLWTSMDYIGEAGIGKCIYTTPEEVPCRRGC